MPIFSTWIAHGRAWFSRIQSRSKRSHRQRQDDAKRRELRLLEIRGTDTQETFARRIAYLRKINPLTFEELVLDGFAGQGWVVERNQRYSGDGGLDGKVYRDGVWYGIQCKRYKGAISTAHVQQFVRDIQRFGLAGGFFVHTGRTPSGIRQRFPQLTILSGQDMIDFLLNTA
jgi:restriction system protein